MRTFPAQVFIDHAHSVIGENFPIFTNIETGCECPGSQDVAPLSGPQTVAQSSSITRKYHSCATSQTAQLHNKMCLPDNAHVIQLAVCSDAPVFNSQARDLKFFYATLRPKTQYQKTRQQNNQCPDKNPAKKIVASTEKQHRMLNSHSN